MAQGGGIRRRLGGLDRRRAAALRCRRRARFTLSIAIPGWSEEPASDVQLHIGESRDSGFALSLSSGGAERRPVGAPRNDALNGERR
jgi:hypothetical protein